MRYFWSQISVPTLKLLHGGPSFLNAFTSKRQQNVEVYHVTLLPQEILLEKPLTTSCPQQKKAPATPAAEYKKTDEPQPDVKEEEKEKEAEEPEPEAEEDKAEEDQVEEEEKSSPGLNPFDIPYQSCSVVFICFKAGFLHRCGKYQSMENHDLHNFTIFQRQEKDKYIINLSL